MKPKAVRCEAPGPAMEDARLAALTDELVLRRLSPRTRKVYLGHARRFVAWAALHAADSGAVEQARRYLLRLVTVRKVSRSYHSQAVSALKQLLSAEGSTEVAAVLRDPRRSVPCPPSSAGRKSSACSRPYEIQSTRRSVHREGSVSS